MDLLQGIGKTSIISILIWRAMQGSNLRPLPCEGSILPLSQSDRVVGCSRLALLVLRLHQRPTRPLTSPPLLEVVERLAGLDENRGLAVEAS